MCNKYKLSGILFIFTVSAILIIFSLTVLAKTPKSKTSIINTEDEITISYLNSTLWCKMGNAVIKGNYTFCSFQYGLVVLDISNPASPEFVSKLYSSEGNIHRIYVDDTIAYLIELRGLKTVSIADPEKPYFVGSYDSPDQLYDMALSDTIAYLADRYNGLRIVNVSHPEAPVGITTNGDIKIPRRVVIIDTLAYVASYTTGLQIVNITDPLTTTIVGNVDTVGNLVDVVVVDTLAYLAASDGGLQIANIADPQNPFIISIFETPTEVLDIAVVDTIAYITDKDSGLIAVNVADPNFPLFISDYDAPGNELTYHDYIYLVDDEVGLEVIDITDPALPVTLGRYETPDGVYDVTIVGDYAYLCGSDLYIVDITAPSNPNVIGICDVPYNNHRLIIDDTIAYLGAYEYPTYDGYLNIVNIADPGAPYPINTIPIPAYPSDIAVKGDYIYISQQYAILIFDVSDPTNPIAEGDFPDSPNHASYIKIIGDLAYVGNFYIYDVSNPQNPVLEGSITGGGNETSVAVQDTIAYVSGLITEGYSGWLFAISINELTNPYFISSIGFSEEAMDVAISNGYAYTANGFFGTYVAIVNIFDPANMYDVGHFSTPRYPSKIEVRDNYIYLACTYGFLIFQIHHADYLCGDVNNTGNVDILDITYLLNYLYNGGQAPNPVASGDVNSSDGINLLDITYIINYLYKGGPVPNCE